MQLTWPITATNWLLESATNLAPIANWQPVPGLSTRSLLEEAQSVSANGSNVFFRLRKP